MTSVWESSSPRCGGSVRAKGWLGVPGRFTGGEGGPPAGVRLPRGLGSDGGPGSTARLMVSVGASAGRTRRGRGGGTDGPSDGGDEERSGEDRGSPAGGCDGPSDAARDEGGGAARPDEPAAFIRLRSSWTVNRPAASRGSSRAGGSRSTSSDGAPSWRRIRSRRSSGVRPRSSSSLLTHVPSDFWAPGCISGPSKNMSAGQARSR